MTRNTKALVVAVNVMFLIDLYECVPINGYKFPVYTTQFCPKNKTEWLQRSRDLNCTDRNGYICVPNEKFTLLMEFCYVKDTVAVPKGFCLFLNKRSSAVDAYECQHFFHGCPSDQYFSNAIYQHQSCVSIVEGCFLADPNCKRTNSASRNTTTPKYNTEKGIQTNITTISEHTFWVILILTIFSSTMAGYCFKTGIKKIAEEIFKKCCEESSLNRNSSSGPLIPTNTQAILLEGPRAGSEESSLNQNLSPGHLTNCTSNQTTEL